MSSQRIVVAGIGYVGLSLAVLLAQKNEVVAIDLDASKVEKVNDRVSPIEDVEISAFFADKELNLTATTDSIPAIAAADTTVSDRSSSRPRPDSPTGNGAMAGADAAAC
jgi:UDPglucose 6-dehydrogenase